MIASWRASLFEIIERFMRAREVPLSIIDLPQQRSADDLTLAEAREQYFRESSLGDGGYNDRWVKLKFGTNIVG